MFSSTGSEGRKERRRIDVGEECRVPALKIETEAEKQGKDVQQGGYDGLLWMLVSPDNILISAQDNTKTNKQ